MKSHFGQGPVVVGLLPDQDPAVLAHAAALAAATGAQMVGAYVDPGSYLIEWDPSGNVTGQSLQRSLEPDDEAASAVLELTPIFEQALAAYEVEGGIRVLGGDTAMALGRLAELLQAAVIVVGARKPGLLAGMNETLAGSVVRKLLATQHTPVLAIPREDAHAPLHG